MMNGATMLRPSPCFPHSATSDWDKKKQKTKKNNTQIIWTRVTLFKKKHQFYSQAIFSLAFGSWNIHHITLQLMW